MSHEARLPRALPPAACPAGCDPCSPQMVTEANCIGVAGDVCTWDKRAESCQAKAMVQLNNDTKAVGAALAVQAHA